MKIIFVLDIFTLDDVLSIDRNPVNKKLPFEVIEGIEGRTEDFLQFNLDGTKVAIHPLVLSEQTIIESGNHKMFFIRIP